MSNSDQNQERSVASKVPQSGEADNKNWKEKFYDWFDNELAFRSITKKDSRITDHIERYLLSPLQEQLREAREEIERMKQSLAASERFRLMDAHTHMVEELRLQEQLKNLSPVETNLINDLLNLLTNLGQIFQILKGEWQECNCWSDWDEEQLSGLVNMLRRLYALKERATKNLSQQPQLTKRMKALIRRLQNKEGRYSLAPHEITMLLRYLTESTPQTPNKQNSL